MGAFGQALGQQTAMGAVNAGVSGLFGAVNSAIGARVGWKYQKKQMALQNKYDIEAFNRENARQDELFRTQLSMQKQGLKNAGYSTANPDSAVLPEATINNQDTPNSTFNPYQTPSLPDFGISYLDMKQGNVADAQSDYYRTLSDKTKSEKDKVDTEVQIMKEQLPYVQSQAKADIFNKVAAGYLSKNLGDKAVKDIELIGRTIALSDIDIKWKPQIYAAEKDKLVQEYKNLVKDGRIKEASAKLADYGIIVGADGITNLVSVFATGDPELIDSVTDGFARLLAKVPGAIKDVIVATKDVAVSGGKSLWNKIKEKLAASADYSDEVDANRADDEFRTAQDNSEYQDMTDYIYQNADKDDEGNISDKEWNYWRKRFYLEKDRK